MKPRTMILTGIGLVGLSGALIASAANNVRQDFDTEAARKAQMMLEEGKKTFRYDTFGSEAFWGDTLQLHKAIAGEKNGGVGPGVSPKTALAVGLKVDVDALPAALKTEIAAGKVNLDDPATTIALLKLNAVVGVTAFTNPDGSVKSMGIQCAFCHSTVDDSFAPGIGKRRDGWSNRDLNVGAIVSLAPNLKPFTDLLGVDEATLKKVLATWGPGRYDAELDKDGKALRPSVSVFGEERCRKHAGHARQGHSKARCAAFLSAVFAGSEGASRVIRRGSIRAREGDLQRRRQVRNLSRAAPLHRARLQLTYARRDGDRRFPGGSLADPYVPDCSAGWPVGASEGWLLS